MKVWFLRGPCRKQKRICQITAGPKAQRQGNRAPLPGMTAILHGPVQGVKGEQALLGGLYVIFFVMSYSVRDGHS